MNNLRVSPLISNIFRRYDAQKFPFEIYVLTFNETYDTYELKKFKDLVKLRHCEKATNFEKNLPLVLTNQLID